MNDTDPVDYEAKRKQARLFWWLVVSVIWELIMYSMGKAAYDQKQAEVQAANVDRNVLSKWWHSGDAWDAAMPYFNGGWLGLIGTFVVAHYISIFQINLQRSSAASSRNRQQRQAQRDFNKRMDEIDRDNAQQTGLSKLALSKQELVMRLGSIDQFIRVMESDTDTEKKIVALQAAQKETTLLAAGLVSGAILSDALNDSAVRDQANETRRDLARVGLSEDRLSRDLVRIFKLKAD